MTPVVLIGGGIALVLAVLAVATLWLQRRIEASHPPDGRFAEAGGIRLHYYDLPPGPSADLVPMVFIHGASGNGRDLMGALAPALQGRGRMLFVDRPGAGYSGRAGAQDARLARQAGYIAGLMDRIGFGPALIVGHSLGAAVATAFALDHPEKTAGLVLVAPATHPWKGNALSWHNRLAPLPLLGALFVRTIAMPLGRLLYRRAVRAVFAPDRVPAGYRERSATMLVLRPSSFRHNAEDLIALNRELASQAPRYGEIGAPTVIVTGDRDAVVSPELHSHGLLRDIGGARLVVIENGGHMPTYGAPGVIVAEIEALNRRIGGAAAVQMPERPSLAT